MITDAPDGAYIDIKVIPRAGRTVIAGTRDGALLVRLAAAPVDGAANAALLDVLSEVLGVPIRRITVVAGEKSRSKRVKVMGASRSQIRERLELPE